MMMMMPNAVLRMSLMEAMDIPYDVALNTTKYPVPKGVDKIVGWTADHALDLFNNFPGDEAWDDTMNHLGKKLTSCFRTVGNDETKTLLVKIVGTCIGYLKGVFIHKKRKPGEWTAIMEPLLEKFGAWWTCTGETMVRDTHSRGVPLNDVLTCVFKASCCVLKHEPLLRQLNSFEQDLVLKAWRMQIRTHGKRALWNIENERATRIANELLSEEETNVVPVPGKRASKRARQRARRRATQATNVAVEEELEDALSACTVHETAEGERETTEQEQETKEEQAKATECVATTEEEEDATLCVICIDAKRTHLVAPCGHKCLCEACSTTIGGACPICRGAAALVCKVFD